MSPTDQLEDLLGKYWDLAHTEGTGKDRVQDPNLILSELRALFRESRTFPAFIIVETENGYSVLGTAKDEVEARSLILLHASGYVDFLDAQNDKFYAAPIPEPKTLKLTIT